MIVTIVRTFKTRKAAERLLADHSAMWPENNWRIVEHDGVRSLVRDWHPSDEGRSFRTLEVTA